MAIHVNMTWSIISMIFQDMTCNNLRLFERRYYMQIYINIQPQVNDRSLTLCSLILQKYKGIKHKLNEVVTCGAGPVLPSVEPQFSPVFCEVSVLRSLVFCVMLSRYCFFTFCPFYFCNCVVYPSSVYTSYYPFDSFKLFLSNLNRLFRKCNRWNWCINPF